MFDKIVKLSSITVGLLILCGILKLIFYYDTFGISIIDYITFSEILTSFLDDVNIIIIIILAMVIQSVPLFNHVTKNVDLQENESAISKMMKKVYPYRFRFFLGFCHYFRFTYCPSIF